MMNFDKMLSRIYKIVKILFFAFLIMSFLKINVDAKEQTTSSFQIYTPYDSQCGSGSSGYCAIQTNNSHYLRQKNNTYNGVLSGIEFYTSYYMNNNYQYSLVINAMSTDFRNNNLFVMACGFADNSPSNCTNIPISYSMVSKSQIKINLPYNNYQNIAYYISGNPLTGINTYGIKSLYYVYDDGSTDMSGVIDNQNQNTSDIINNNNSNTEDIIDNQNQNTFDLIESAKNNSLDVLNAQRSDATRLCKNVYPQPLYTGKHYTNNGNLADGTGFYTELININYFSEVTSLKISSPVDTTSYHRINIYDSNRNYIGGTYTGRRTINLSNYPGATYFAYSTPDTTTFVSANTFECLTTDDAINDFLQDDSNPTINDNDLQNTMNSVNVSNPLEYFLTLPTTLLSKIQDGLDATSCTAVQLGHFGQLGRHDLSGYTFTLPCINFEQKLGSTLWNTIDLFVAIGILALTIYKLYESISNILTLGAEDEVKAHLSFLSPMEFLASIIGNGGFSTFTSQVYRGGR